MSIEIDWVEYAVEGVVRGTDERIKVVDEFHNYFVTTEGRVFSAKGMGMSSPNFDNLKEKAQVWRGAPAKKYWITQLWHDWKIKTVGIHILVAKAFIPNPNNLPVVNHLKYPSNKVEDLEWSTQRDNCDHGANTKEWMVEFPDGSIRQIRNLNKFVEDVVQPDWDILRSRWGTKFKTNPVNGYKLISKV